MSRGQRALAAMCGQPWAIVPDWLNVMAAIVQGDDAAPELVAVRDGRPMRGARRAEERDGVAVIPVTGPIFPRANLLTEHSGATSLDVMARDLQAALDDPQIRAVLLDVDSPGGLVTGIGEMATTIMAARGTKPIVAYVGGYGASAAYWLASAADEIVTDPTAMLGSIGVRVMTMAQEAPDQHGYRHFDIVSSNAENKSADPRSQQGLAEIRRVIDGIEGKFIAAVARQRNVAEAVVRQDFGRGGILLGDDAVKVGMADRLGSFESVLAELQARAQGGPAPSQPAPRSDNNGDRTMADKVEAPALPATMNAADVAGRWPEAANALRGEGAKAERERIGGITAAAKGFAGHDALVAELIADGKSSPAEAALRILNAERGARQGMLEAIKADGEVKAAPPAPTTTGAPAIDANAPIEQRAEAEWNRDPKLQAEFATRAAYVAFRKAEAGGRVRFLRSSKSAA